jgi:hypothetical protein
MTDNDAIESDNDVRDAVRAAIASNSDGPAEPEQRDAVDDAAAAVQQHLEEPADAARLKRDERGRFASSKAAPEETYETHRGKREYPTYTNGFDGQAKLDLDNASPALRAAIEKREAEIAEGFRRYGEERQAMDAVLGEHRENFRAAGFTSDAHVVAHLMSVSNQLAKDPIGTISQYVQTLPPQQQQQFRAAFGGTQTGYTDQQMQQALEQQFQSLVNEARGMMAQREKAAAEAAVAKYRQDQARTAQKVRASNASMNGAPHGVAAAPPPRKSNGHFGDVAASVLDAVNALR